MGEDSESAVLCGLHKFTLTRPLVIDSAEVQNAVDDDTVQLLLVGLVEPLGIEAHGVEADEEVARDDSGCTVIKGDDVCVVVVLQKLAVDAQDFLIIHKDVGDVAHLATVGGSHSLNPSHDGSLVDGRERDIDGLEGNQVES